VLRAALPWKERPSTLTLALTRKDDCRRGIEGGNYKAATGNYVVVWKRGKDGAWRLKVDTWNDTPPAAKTQSTSGDDDVKPVEEALEGVVLHEQDYHRRLRCLKMLIRLEGAHGFYVSTFGKVDPLRPSRPESNFIVA
jgi:hypothetical protein